MNENLKNIANDMKELGLAALSHANKRYSNMDKGGELSVLKAAHAAEILIKARIAEEHPLLIFDKIPKAKTNELSLEELFKDSITTNWSKLPDLLWAATGKTIPCIKTYNSFGLLRNGIQHFGVIPVEYQKTTTPESETFKFIYSIIDPMINDWWDLSALDYCEDKLINDEEFESFTEENPYWRFVSFIISEELTTNLPEYVIENKGFWQDVLNDKSSDYIDTIKAKISQSN